jgi:hypothetical protein
MEINKSAVDIFTLVHFAIGVWVGQFLTVPQTALMFSGYEILERYMKNIHPEFFPHPGQDTIRNSVIDVLAGSLGAFYVRCSMTQKGLLKV